MHNANVMMLFVFEILSFKKKTQPGNKYEHTGLGTYTNIYNSSQHTINTYLLQMVTCCFYAPIYNRTTQAGLT